MSGLLFLFGSALAPVRSELGNGLHVVLEPAPDAAAGLIAFAAGAIAGKHARVWLDGKDPHGDPGVRATIASLQGTETLLPAPTVLASLQGLLPWRGDATRARAFLESWGLAALAGERPERLEPRELRSVALALALAHPAPSLLALHEPLTTDLRPARVRSAIAAAAENAIVLATVSRFEDARALGGRVLRWQGGAFQALNSERFGTHALRVRSRSAGELAAALADVPEVRQVTRVGLRELVVHGPELEPLARAVAERAHGAGLSLEGLREQIDPFVLASQRGAP